MSLASLIARFPPDFEIVLADVGSAGGLHGRWQGARAVVSGVLFEPREGGEVRREGRDTVYPIGLGEGAGTATLNLTALPNMSSTLQPDADLLQTFAKKGEHTRITGTIEMPVDSLDAIAARDGLRIDAIKVDTQGSELGILQGARQCLQGSVVMAEVEVSFFHRYREQAVLGDIVGFMGDHGFELIDLYRLKRYRRRNAARIGNLSLGSGQRAGRLAYGDAHFCLREDVLRSRLANAGDAEGTVLRSVLATMIYGKPDMAAYLFDTFGAAVREPWRAEIAAWFSRLGKRPLRTGVLHHVFDYLGRRV